MSDVKRYDVEGDEHCWMEEYPDGDYVLHSDYLALQAKFEVTTRALRLIREHLGVFCANDFKAQAKRDLAIATYCLADNALNELLPKPKDLSTNEG